MTSPRSNAPARRLALLAFLAFLALALPAVACRKQEADAAPWRTRWAKAHDGVRKAIADRASTAELRAAIDRAAAAMERWQGVPAARPDLARFADLVAAWRDEARAAEALEAGGAEIALVLLARARALTELPEDRTRLDRLEKRATDQRGYPEPGAPKVPGMLFKAIPKGKYVVGTPPLSTRSSDLPDPEQGRDDSLEIAPTSVSVEQFWIATTETTQEVYRELGGEGIPPAAREGGPGGSRPDSSADDAWRPAYGMTLDQATAFCRRLDAVDAHFAFRLPTEVEWEVACRATEPPSKGPFPLHPKHGDEGKPGNWPLLLETYAVYDSARYAGRSESEPLPVASRAPNPLGLYDMLGNVEEWCTGVEPFQYKSGLEPIRGGSLRDTYGACRAGARRLQSAKGRTGSAIGIRVVAVSR